MTTLLVGGLTLPAPATVIVQRSFAELCSRAEKVFIGTVTTVESSRDLDSQYIHTFTTFEQVQWIAGENTETTETIRTLGGSVDGETLTVHSMPRFHLGRRYLVFVRGNSRIVCPIVGWRQGCFTISSGHGGTPPTVQKYDGTPVTDIVDGRFVLQSPDDRRKQPQQGITLERFIQSVRSNTSTNDLSDAP